MTYTPSASSAAALIGNLDPPATTTEPTLPLTIPNGGKPATGWPMIIFNHGFITPDVYARPSTRWSTSIGWRAAVTSCCDLIIRGHDQSEGENSGRVRLVAQPRAV